MTSSAYTLELSDSERKRYAWMAEKMLECEIEWLLKAGIAKSGIRVLDAGCGMGYPSCALTSLLAKDSSIVGIDSSMQSLEWAKELRDKSLTAATKNRLNFCGSDIVSTAFKPESFDFVMLRFVLLHNGSVAQQALRQFKELLKPGGVLYIADTDATATRMFPEDKFLTFIGRQVVKMLVNAGNDVRVGLSIEELLADAGFDVILADQHLDRLKLSSEIRLPIWDSRAALRQAELISNAELQQFDTVYTNYYRAPGTKYYWSPVYVAAGRKQS